MIRFGILGLGNIAHRFAKSLAHHPEAELFAVASSSPQKQETFQTLYHAQWCTDQYEALIQHPDVDVVYIATPHKDHAKWIECCIAHHKAVLCEKPMTLSEKETTRLIRLAKEQHVFLMEALKGWFIPGTDRLCQMIDEGIIGDVLQLEASFDSDVPYMPDRYLFEKGQGGALNDVGIYPLSFALKVLHAPISHVEVEYRMHALAPVDSFFSAKLCFTNQQEANISGAIDFSREKAAKIVGTKGTMTVPYYYRPVTWTVNKEDTSTTYQEPLLVDDMYGEINEVVQCLKNHQIESSIYTHQHMIEMAHWLDVIREKMVIVND